MWNVISISSTLQSVHHNMCKNKINNWNGLDGLKWRIAQIYLSFSSKNFENKWTKSKSESRESEIESGREKKWMWEGEEEKEINKPRFKTGGHKLQIVFPDVIHFRVYVFVLYRILYLVLIGKGKSECEWSSR